MAYRVGVVDPVHYYRMGVVAALNAAGFDAVGFDTLSDNVASEEDHTSLDLNELRAVVISIRAAQDLERTRELSMRDELVVVALVTEDTLEDWVEAISAGADAVVHRRAHPDLTLDAIRAAAQGMTLVPTDVVRAFVDEYRSLEASPTLGNGRGSNGNGSNGNGNRGSDGTVQRPAPSPDDRDVRWLRRLAEGVTVAKLAQEACYSEREMYRILHTVYERLGARNRTDALMKAAQLGLFQ